MLLWHYFNLWIQMHQTHTLGDYLAFAGCGLLGAAGYAAASMPEWTLPSRDKGILKLNIVNVFIAGIVLAVIADYAVPVSLIAGVVGAPGLKLLNQVVLKAATLRINSIAPDEEIQAK